MKLQKQPQSRRRFSLSEMRSKAWFLTTPLPGFSAHRGACEPVQTVIAFYPQACNQQSATSPEVSDDLNAAKTTSSMFSTDKIGDMMDWGATFFFLAVIMAILGFSGYAGQHSDMAKAISICLGTLFAVLWVSDFIAMRDNRERQ